MDHRKDFYKRAVLNAKARGLVLKKIPQTLLRKCHKNPRPASVTQSCQAWMPKYNVIRGWARGDLQQQYLTEVLQGEPWSLHPNNVVAFTGVWNAATGRYDFVPVGYVCYGTFDRRRRAPGYNWDITFKGTTAATTAQAAQLNAEAIGRRVAEVEVVVRSNDAASLGVGELLLQYATGDLLSRKKGNGPRYSSVLMFTNSQSLQARGSSMGYRARLYDYGGDEITADLVDAEAADDPNSLPCYVLTPPPVGAPIQQHDNFWRLKFQYLGRHSRGLPRMCPTKRQPADQGWQYWQLCR